MRLRFMSIDEINEFPEFIELVCSLYGKAYPNFFEYEFNDSKRYLYRDENCFTIMYRDGDGILYSSFCLDMEYNLYNMEFDEFFVTKGQQYDQLWKEGSPIIESLIYTPKSDKQVGNIYDGVLCYNQYNSVTNESLATYYDTYYSESRQIMPFHYRNIHSYIHQKGNKLTYYVSSNIDSDSYIYDLITIREFGLSQVLSKGSYQLQKEESIKRYFQMSKLPKSSDSTVWLLPFYKTYNESEMKEMIERNGFKTAIPEYVVDYFNRNYEEQEEYEQLTKAIKEYDIENNVFMILNLDRGPIC